MSSVSPTTSDEQPTRFRWQIILLALGLLMIAAAAVLAILPSDRPAAADAPPEIQLSQSAVFREALVGPPRYVNPLLAVSDTDRDLSRLIFSGLTRVDEFGQPVPDLAESWTVSADGLTYTFTLRDDVTWHDGEPFTAADVDFTMALLRDPHFPGPRVLGEFWRTVETYIVDERTVRFVLTQPLTSFPEYAGVGLLPAHWLAGVDAAALPDDPFNLAPVGTGPLRWLGVEPRDNVEVVRLEPYAGFYDPQRRVTLEAVEFYAYEGASSAFRALGTDVLAMGGLSASQLDAALTSPLVNVYSSRLPVYGVVIFNQGDSERLPFFQEEKVRRALVQALDREALIAGVMGRQAMTAVSPILPGSWAAHPSLAPLPYDPAAAAALLDEAGWGLNGTTREREGVRLAFTLLVSSRDVHRDLGEQIAAAWRDLGVDVTVRTVTDAQLAAQLQPDDEGLRPYDAALVELGLGGFADPDPYPFWHESQIVDGQNYSAFVDHDMSQDLEIARRDPNGVRRAELYRAFQEAFVEQAAAVMLYNPLYHYAVSCQVVGVQVRILATASDRFEGMHAWRILSPEQAATACGIQATP
ncbi:MAG: peptide ABC transporter substrate-binding protein [Anaerolineae bacterium]